MTAAIRYIVSKLGLAETAQRELDRWESMTKARQTNRGCVEMAEPLGYRLSPDAPKPISPQSSNFGQKLSDKARQDIEKIEANARTTEQRNGSLILK
jgi:hypothetical protein